MLKKFLAIPFSLIASFSYAGSVISVPIHYDSLSFLEEPLAFNLGDITFNTNGLVDQAVQYDLRNTNNQEEQFNTRAIASFAATTQLSNSWDLGVQYIANYNRLRDDEYTDTASISISDEWGTVALGNVTGSVFELSRRQRGVGNAALSNDNFLGALDQDGAFYSVRYNMVQLAATADAQGNFETGIIFEQPIGQSQYFSSLRVRKANTDNNPIFPGASDTLGAAWVGSYQYASYLLDAQIGYENIDIAGADEKDDFFFSSLGAGYKYGAYSFSLEGGFGRYDGQNMRSASFGNTIDIARGLSFNIGVNYLNQNNEDFAEAVSSLRYNF